MTDIVERLLEQSKCVSRSQLSAGINGLCSEAAYEIERLRARLETVRHEAQAATKLVLEHQSKNCHLHAEIERLREALGDN